MEVEIGTFVCEIEKGGTCSILLKNKKQHFKHLTWHGTFKGKDAVGTLES